MKITKLNITTTTTTPPTAPPITGAIELLGSSPSEGVLSKSSNTTSERKTTASVKVSLLPLENLKIAC